MATRTLLGSQFQNAWIALPSDFTQKEFSGMKFGV